MDCMEYLRTLPDNFADLALVDPPYGLGIDGQKLNNTNKNPKHNRKAHNFKGWDNAIPDKLYFDELFRISKHQIIWGGNYFTEHLRPTKAWIFWYKGQNDLTMSDGEMAWTSFETVTRQIQINRFQIKLDNGNHPTAKPIKLYSWIYANYLPQGGKVIDTYLGSGSNRIAADKAGNIDFYATEIDKDYFEAQEKRWREYKAQAVLTFPERIDPVQSALF